MLIAQPVCEKTRVGGERGLPHHDAQLGKQLVVPRRDDDFTVGRAQRGEGRDRRMASADRTRDLSP